MRCAGAEVVRLYEQVLGKEGFRKGMDLYFQRHDGQVRQYSRARPAPHLDSHLSLAERNGEHAPYMASVHDYWLSCVIRSSRYDACAAPMCHLQAVTCDDFLAAMADANGEDLSELAK